MAGKILTLLFLFIFSLSVHSQTLDKEALSEINQFWNNRTTKCDGNVYSNFVGNRIIQFLNPKISLQKLNVSNVDRLNGIEYKALSKYSSEATREFFFQTTADRSQIRGWTKWYAPEEAPNLQIEVPIRKENGEWYFTMFGFVKGLMKVDCSELANLGGITNKTTLRVFMVVRMKNSQKNPGEDGADDEIVNQTIEILRKRLKMFGLAAFSVEKSKGPSKEIEIKLPANDNPELVKEVIGMNGRFEIVQLISPPSPSPIETFATYQEALASVGGKVPSNRQILRILGNESKGTDSNRWVLAESQPIIETGDFLKCQVIPILGQNSNYKVSCFLKQDGKNKVVNWVRSNLKQYVGITFNDNVGSVAVAVSKPQTNESFTIPSVFSKSRADAIVAVLMSGAFPRPYQLEFEEERLLKENEIK